MNDSPFSSPTIIGKTSFEAASITWCHFGSSRQSDVMAALTG